MLNKASQIFLICILVFAITFSNITIAFAENQATEDFFNFIFDVVKQHNLIKISKSLYDEYIEAGVDPDVARELINEDLNNVFTNDSRAISSIKDIYRALSNSQQRVLLDFYDQVKASSSGINNIHASTYNQVGLNLFNSAVASSSQYVSPSNDYPSGTIPVTKNDFINIIVPKLNEIHESGSNYRVSSSDFNSINSGKYYIIFDMDFSYQQVSSTTRNRRNIGLVEFSDMPDYVIDSYDSTVMTSSGGLISDYWVVDAYYPVFHGLNMTTFQPMIHPSLDHLQASNVLYHPSYIYYIIDESNSDPGTDPGTGSNDVININKYDFMDEIVLPKFRAISDWLDESDFTNWRAGINDNPFEAGQYYVFFESRYDIATYYYHTVEPYEPANDLVLMAFSAYPDIAIDSNSYVLTNQYIKAYWSATEYRMVDAFFNLQGRSMPIIHYTIWNYWYNDDYIFSTKNLSYQISKVYYIIDDSNNPTYNLNIQDIINNVFITINEGDTLNYYSITNNNTYNQIDPAWFDMLMMIIQGFSVPTITITINNYPNSEDDPITYDPVDLSGIENILHDILDVIKSLVDSQNTTNTNLVVMNNNISTHFNSLNDTVSSLGNHIDDMSLNLSSKLDTLHDDIAGANLEYDGMLERLDLSIIILFLLLSLAFIFFIIYFLKLIYSFIWSFIAPFFGD